MLQVLDIANFFMAMKGAVLHGTPANAIAAFAMAIRPPKRQNSGSRWHRKSGQTLVWVFW